MNRRLMALLVLLVAATTVAAFAGKNTGNTGLNANFLPLPSGSFGVSDDGNPSYINGAAGVQCYLGAGGKDVDLVTYGSSTRTLHFAFDPASPALAASGLSSAFNAPVDFYGVNFFGPYVTQGIGTTAQVQASLQFKVGGQTYELFYQSLASKRESANTWLITSDPTEIGGFPGFTASSQAAFNILRKRGPDSFGAVNMPIHFEVVLQ